MRPPAYPLLVASSIVLAAVPATPATRPHYGGTLRVEIQAKVATLDPSEPPDVDEATAINKLRALIFDRLVRLDCDGKPQPALAASWEHDERSAKWRFKLRAGVKWQDGSPLTPLEVLASLEGMAPGGSLRLAGDTLEINAGRPRPNLLVTLATDPALVIRRPAISSTNSLPIGTGSFRLTEWVPGRHAVFEAFEDYWAGRPFLDKIEIQMGRSSREQLLDLELGKADVVTLDPSEARRAQQEGKKVWSSLPIELLFLRWDLPKNASQDRRIREAVAEAIDRASIQKVLAQNFGEVAGGIFPRWLSGYSFLFPTAADLDHARQLVREVGTPPTLRLGYDASDTLARQSAERIAVNARDAGLTLQVSPLPEGWWRMPDTATDMRLERIRIDGPNFAAAVAEAGKLHLEVTGAPDHPEDVYTAEQKLLAPFSIVPLVYVPEIAGLSARVRHCWTVSLTDGRFDDFWLGAEKP